jgi:hypothetical protein
MLRYFLRRDSVTRISGGDAASLLEHVGHQLAARHPELFEPDRLEIVIEQRVGRAARGASVVGAQIDDLRVSPFYRTAIRVTQDVGDLAGDLTALRIGYADLGPRLRDPDVLQYLALLDPAAADPARQFVVLIDALDEVARYPGRLNVLDWLVSSPELPANVRLVLTSRPGKSLDAFRSARGGSIEEIDIATSSDRVHADARTFTGRLFADPVVRVSDPHDAADKVADRSEGNFAYLTFYGRALRSAASAGNDQLLLALLQFEALPAGLNALYGHFLALLKDDINRLGALEVDPASGAASVTGWVSPWEAGYLALFLSSDDLPGLTVAQDSRMPGPFAADDAFVQLGGTRTGMVRWQGRKGDPIQALVDIRWVFPDEDAASAYHRHRLGANSEGQPPVPDAPLVGDECAVHGGTVTGLPAGTRTGTSSLPAPAGRLSFAWARAAVASRAAARASISLAYARMAAAASRLSSSARSRSALRS